LTTKNRIKTIQILWLLASFLVSTWFFYWISYEAFIWNKYLLDATTINYIAFTTSLTLLIIGAQLQKIRSSKKPIPVKQKNLEKSKQTNTITNCKFYMGYLHKHPKYIQTPDECLLCPHIVECTKEKEPTLRQ
jgi:hypothetical protein